MTDKDNKLAQNLSRRSLLRFAFPTALMMLLVSTYSVIDGLFASHFVGSVALAAIALVSPLIMVLTGFGFMLGVGSAALVAKTMGQGDLERARGLFSFFVLSCFALGVALAVVGIPLLPSALRVMGAEEQLAAMAAEYGTILLLSLPASILQGAFEEYYATTGKPSVGLVFSLAAGMVNVVLDYIFMGPLGLGVVGAAAATALGEVVGGLLPLAFFASSRSGLLRLVKPIVDFRALGAAVFNGISEMVDSISGSIVSAIYNVQLLAYLGQEGVAAFAVIEYALMVVTALEMGYIMGMSPMISYKYGAQDKAGLRSLFAKNVQIVSVMNVVFTVATLVLSPHIVALFAHDDAQLAALATQALSVYAFAFLLIGFNFFGSVLFTALGNGVVSAAISFFRTLVCESAFVLTLPLVMGAQGIWVSAPCAEVVAFALTAVLVVRMRKRYGYL